MGIRNLVKKIFGQSVQTDNPPPTAPLDACMVGPDYPDPDNGWNEAASEDFGFPDLMKEERAGAQISSEGSISKPVVMFGGRPHPRGEDVRMANRTGSAMDPGFRKQILEHLEICPDCAYEVLSA